MTSDETRTRGRTAYDAAAKALAELELELRVQDTPALRRGVSVAPLTPAARRRIERTIKRLRDSLDRWDSAESADWDAEVLDRAETALGEIRAALQDRSREAAAASAPASASRTYGLALASAEHRCSPSRLTAEDLHVGRLMGLTPAQLACEGDLGAILGTVATTAAVAMLSPAELAAAESMGLHPVAMATRGRRPSPEGSPALAWAGEQALRLAASRR